MIAEALRKPLRNLRFATSRFKRNKRHSSFEHQVVAIFCCPLRFIRSHFIYIIIISHDISGKKNFVFESYQQLTQHIFFVAISGPFRLVPFFWIFGIFSGKYCIPRQKHPPCFFLRLPELEKDRTPKLKIS